MTAQQDRTMTDTRLRDRTCMLPTLSEVGESESDDDGRKRALSSTNNLAHVDGDLAVCGTGRDDGTVASRVRVSGTQKLASSRNDI